MSAFLQNYNSPQLGQNQYFYSVKPIPLPFRIHPKAILLSLFMVFHVVEYLGGQFSFALQDISTNEYNRANWEGVDIAQRLQFWKWSLLIGIPLTLAFVVLWNLLIDRIGARRLAVPAFLSGWIFALQLFGLTGNPQAFACLALEIWFVLSLVYTLFLRVHELHLHRIFLETIAVNVSLYALLMLLDAQEHFLPKDLSADVLFSICAALSVILRFIPTPRFSNTQHTLLVRIMLFLPLVYVICVELVLILNARAIYIKSPLIVFPWILLLFFTWIYFKKPRFIFKGSTRGFYLLLLVAITVPAYYLAQYHYHCDPFELANPANAMMRTYESGQLPFIDFFSSHVLSEQCYGWVYYALHGYHHDLGFMSYVMFDRMVYSLVLFFVLRFALQSSWWSFFIVVFFPFTETLLPLSFSLLPVSAVLLYRLQRQFDRPAVAAIAAWVFFLMFWRIDLGLACLLAMGLVSLVIWYRNGIREHLSTVFLPLLMFFIMAATILVMLYFSPSWSSIQLAIHQIIAYVSANQAHGLPVLHQEYNTVFYLHYFVLPAVVIGIGLITLFRLAKAQEHKNDILISFLAWAYVFNVQRGLVRHSLFEGHDAFISSFGLLVIFLFLFSHYRKSIPYLLFAIGFFALSFSFPQRKSEQNVFSHWQHQLSNFPKTGGMQTYLRVNNDEASCLHGITELKTFADQHFAPSSTFIDLSNQPMLYYFLQRPVPSYFNQALQNVMTVDMQENYLSQLKKMDVPFVVYAHDPPLWFDDIDALPNALRYHVVNRFVMEHYFPYRTIGAYRVWIKKSLASTFTDRDENCNPPMHVDFRLNAQYRKAVSSDTSNFAFGNKDTAFVFPNMDFQKEDGHLQLLMKNASSEKKYARVECFSQGTLQGSFGIELPPGTWELRIPIGYQPRIYQHGIAYLVFHFPLELRCGNPMFVKP